MPHVEDLTRPGALWPALKAEWPSFLAYLIMGCVIYSSTTVLSYWFPITGVVIIFFSQALWIIVSVNENEKLM